MSRVLREMWHCDVCGWEWMPDAERVPVRRPHRKCGTRHWNLHDAPSEGRPSPVQVAAAIPGVVTASSLPPRRPVQPVQAVAAKTPAAATAHNPYARPAHASTCRCAMCRS